MNHHDIETVSADIKGFHARNDLSSCNYLEYE